MVKLEEVGIRHSPLSGRILIARFGKDPKVALETRDIMSEFWQALVSYGFDGKMPDPGQAVEIKFGGGDENFTITLARADLTSTKENTDAE